MFTHDLPFDPTYGYDEAQLRSIEPPPAPEDFASFWQSQYHRALDVPTRFEMVRALETRRSDVVIEQVGFDAMGLHGAPAVRLGGWLITPTRGSIRRLLVVGHGYGGREAPEVGANIDGVAMLKLCCRGFHLSTQPDLPVNDSSKHVIHGIESRETYVHLGNAADIWAAVKVMRERFPEHAGQLDYSGGSFGGGIGALAMPWDARVRRVVLDVPSFGNHPLRLRLQCTGSGEAVRQLHQQRDVLPVLRYFDAAVAARFMRQPTLVGCALFDPAVPPPGQFSVYNALTCRKQLIVRPGGHWEYPSLPREVVRFDRAAREWLDSL
ncbi:MAG TPA: acetylxylan esterase [Tepidisphaeraceae bacterium]|nr:acetylxylan esterase [Tepidisphaeraceae bacterium]